MPDIKWNTKKQLVASMIIRKALEDKGWGKDLSLVLEETPECVEEMADGQVIFRGEWGFFTRN